MSFTNLESLCAEEETLEYYHNLLLKRPFLSNSLVDSINSISTGICLSAKSVLSAKIDIYESAHHQ
jgi:hypothetical protein